MKYTTILALVTVLSLTGLSACSSVSGLGSDLTLLGTAVATESSVIVTDVLSGAANLGNNVSNAFSH